VGLNRLKDHVQILAYAWEVLGRNDSETLRPKN
jgi:hypothetical protein